MYKYTLLFAFTLFSNLVGFAQNQNIEKVWQLQNIYGDVHTFSAIDSLISSEKVFQLAENGNIISFRKSSIICPSGTDNTAQAGPPQIIGKWKWLNSKTIAMEYYSKGLRINKKFTVYKVTDTELTLIDLKQ